MEQITIGSSGVTASRIGLGTWAIGGWMWGGADERQAIDTIRVAVERGVTLIDTAPIYGFGRSEEIVGKALAEGGLRDKMVIATKAGLAWGGGKITRDSRPARLRQEIEDSLRRLGVEAIDLYQIHWPDEATPFDDTARAAHARPRAPHRRWAALQSRLLCLGIIRALRRCRVASSARLRHHRHLTVTFRLVNYRLHSLIWETSHCLETL